MRRPAQTFALLVLMSFCFMTHGKLPRLPELRGTDTLELAQRFNGEKSLRT
ncbi:MAG: hypothetical protein ACRCYS_17820 [Beijerinckiaceae bacterium]